MMRLALAVALASCAASPPVVVRMAQPGDKLPSIPPEQRLPDGQRLHSIGCRQEGALDEGLDEPILRFARTHLAEYGEVVRITARAEVGSLQISNAPHTWHHGSSYCVVVFRTAKATTVVLWQDSIWFR